MRGNVEFADVMFDIWIFNVKLPLTVIWRVQGAKLAREPLMWECWNHKTNRPVKTLAHALSQSVSRHCITTCGFENREHFRWPSRVRLLVSKSLIVRRKSKNYTSSLKCWSPVVKGLVWGWWYSWAQHLESLSSTNELWWKTNVSASPLPHSSSSSSLL